MKALCYRHIEFLIPQSIIFILLDVFGKGFGLEFNLNETESIRAILEFVSESFRKTFLVSFDENRLKIYPAQFEIPDPNKFQPNFQSELFRPRIHSN